MGVIRARKFRRQRTHGMAMVEMVLVLPVLLLVVFAIAEFGLMFKNWLTLSNAVREGARFGVVFDTNCDPSGASVVDKVKDYAEAGGGIDTSKLAVTVTGMCQGPTVPLVVNATYQFPLNIPFGPAFGDIPLQYTSTMRNEG